MIMISDEKELICGDAYKVVNKLIDEKLVVNHIITDPPYNISKKNNFVTMKNPRKGIDFGEWDNGQFDLYSWIPKYTQILDKNGSIVIFCSYRFISYLVDVLEQKSGMEVKDVIIWQKTNPMPRNIERRYVQDMEFAIWAVKKKSKWVFNKPSEKSYLRSIYSSSLVSGTEKLGHPTQKSFKVLQEIIMVHTNPGDIILDPFMGSGTTGDAALSVGRKFIGVEMDKGYYKMTENRLKKYERKKG